MNDTSPQPVVFVLMPFEASYDEVYALGIKPACQEAGARAERVDEQIFQESILEHIYRQIREAAVIVADMSNRNPNVYYETGYAHALGKPVILLTRQADDIPFDLKHYPHIVYGDSITTLSNELAKRLRWLLENPPDAPPARNDRLVERYERDLPSHKDKPLFYQLKELIQQYEYPEYQFDVFVSYSSADESEAEILSDKITKAGLRAFIDRKALQGGASFSDEIRAALRSSYEIWALLTPNSLKSEWVTTEWGAGWVLGKRVVPILLRCSIDNLPERLRAIHSVDFHNIDTLIADLQARLEHNNA